ncbi:MAG: hypothetical protein IJL77_04010 [Clostridia bacterium]|nr:hypothetical protein [Clostridia bacterium]
MKCAYCEAEIPENAAECPDCGKAVDKTGLGSTLKFYDCAHAVRVSAIEHFLAACVFGGLAYTFIGSLFPLGLKGGIHISFNLFDCFTVIAALFALSCLIRGIILLINAKKYFFSVKAHGVKGCIPGILKATRSLSLNFDEISYVNHTMHLRGYGPLTIGTKQGKKIYVMTLMRDEAEFVYSHIRSVLSSKINGFEG